MNEAQDPVPQPVGGPSSDCPSPGEADAAGPLDTAQAADRGPISSACISASSYDRSGPYSWYGDLWCNDGAEGNGSRYLSSCDGGYSDPGLSADGLPDGNSSAPALKMVHVGPSLVRAGIEVWLKGLIRFLGPRRVRLVRCIATIPQAFDHQFASELQVPAVLGDRDDIRRAAAECDVLLVWGPSELTEWLSDCRPRLCVFVAHGEGDFTRAMLQGCSRVVDHVVAVSRRVKERVTEGFPTTVIPNGVDSAHIARSLSRDEARRRFGFSPSDFVLGYVGRFAWEKRAELLIAAVAQMPPRFKALLVGWGPLYARILDMANRLIPGRFAITLGGSNMGDYYEAIDALCMVSSEEGYPLVVIEAMMCGKPVIATPVGAIPDIIIDRVTGLIVSGGVESISAAAHLLANHPDWSRGLATEAKAYADRHGHARQMARSYEDLILRLWRERHGRSSAATRSA